MYVGPRKFTEFGLECIATDPALACWTGGELNLGEGEGMDRKGAITEKTVELG